MKELSFEQMEKVNGGLNQCEWGMLGVNVIMGAAIGLTGGVGAVVAGAVYTVAWAKISDYVCNDLSRA